MLKLRRLLGSLQGRLQALPLWTYVSRAEGRTLFALMLGAAALYVFAALADAVGEGDTRAFDEWVLLSLRTPGDVSDPIGPKWFEEMVRDITALGGTIVLALMVSIVAGFLVLTGKRHAATTVVISVASGVLISQTTKMAYARPRPDLVPHGAEVLSASFPSGHSMMAAVVYLTLGALLAHTQADTRVKAYILAVGVLLTLLVGASRVYLGVHWPTDVLAGWALGAAWAMICWWVMLWLQSRGAVEPEAEDRP